MSLYTEKGPTLLWLKTRFKTSRDIMSSTFIVERKRVLQHKMGLWTNLFLAGKFPTSGSWEAIFHPASNVKDFLCCNTPKIVMKMGSLLTLIGSCNEYSTVQQTRKWNPSKILLICTHLLMESCAHWHLACCNSYFHDILSICLCCTILTVQHLPPLWTATEWHTWHLSPLVVHIFICILHHTHYWLDITFQRLTHIDI